MEQEQVFEPAYGPLALAYAICGFYISYQSGSLSAFPLAFAAAPIVLLFTLRVTISSAGVRLSYLLSLGRNRLILWSELDEVESLWPPFAEDRDFVFVLRSGERVKFSPMVLRDPGQLLRLVQGQLGRWQDEAQAAAPSRRRSA